MAEISRSQKLIKNLIGFLETKIEIIKLDIKEEFSEVVSKMVMFMIALFLLFSTIMFASITLANYLNHLFSSNFIGHGIIAIFYLLLIGLIYLMKDKKVLKKFVSNQIKKHLK